VKLLGAEFVTSAARADGIPRDEVPRIALAGRSNVGKSSLINALCRSKIARTSAAPGKTQLVNFYRASLEGGHGGPGRWSLYLVDLPGYGYARGGAMAAAELASVAQSYFADAARDSRPRDSSARDSSARDFSRASGTPRGSKDTELKFRAPVLLLVDARHPGLQADLDAARWLAELGVERHIIATKIDKLSRNERAKTLRSLETAFGMPALPVSATSGEGMDELWRTIARLVRTAE
jgi:GTP-binding protein